MTNSFKCTVAAALAAVGISLPGVLWAQADPDKVADLLNQLATAESPAAAARVAEALRTEWSKSGSAAIDLLLRRGNDAMEAGEFETAANHFTAAIDHDPAFPEAWAARASAYYSLGLIGPALDDLRQALVLNPSHFEVLTGFAVMLEEMGRPAEALEVFRQAQAINPQDELISGAVARIERDLEGTAL